MTYKETKVVETRPSEVYGKFAKALAQKACKNYNIVAFRPPIPGETFLMDTCEVNDYCNITIGPRFILRKHKDLDFESAWE